MRGLELYLSNPPWVLSIPFFFATDTAAGKLLLRVSEYHHHGWAMVYLARVGGSSRDQTQHLISLLLELQ